MSKKTLVMGASPTTTRYAFRAVKRLLHFGHPVVAIGKVAGEIETVSIIRDTPDIPNLHTVTMYLNAAHQEQYLEYIIGLKPKRIIFNPGSYNPTLDKLARQHRIEVVEDCTLVMLETNNY